MNTVRYEVIDAQDVGRHAIAVQVLQKSFFQDEAICKSGRVPESPAAVEQLCELVRISLKDGASVAAYKDDVMVGVSINKIQVPQPQGEQSFFHKFNEEKATDPSAKFVMDFMIRVDSMADVFAALNAQRVLELMFLSVLPAARGCRVAANLVEETLRLASKMQPKVDGVCSIFSSDYSMAAGKRAGFEELAVLEHKELLIQGKPMSESLPPEQQRSVLSVYKIK